jgi:hypothetical protein
MCGRFKGEWCQAPQISDLRHCAQIDAEANPRRQRNESLARIVEPGGYSDGIAPKAEPDRVAASTTAGSAALKHLSSRRQLADVR